MKRYLAAALFVLLLTSDSYSQEGYEHLGVFAHGSGRTYVVNTDGLSAVGLNPALIHFRGKRDFEVRIFPISVFGLDAGSSFRDASVLADVFAIKPDSTGTISDERKNDIINTLNDNKMSGRGDAAVLGVLWHTPNYGTFAFTWTTHAAMRTDIPQAFLDFFYRAERELLQGEGHFTNFDLQGMWYNQYSLTYGKDVYTGLDAESFLKTIFIGGAVKYVSGIGILKLDEGNLFAYNRINGGSHIDVSFRVFSAYSEDFDPQNAPTSFKFSFLTSTSAGSGLGFDIGTAATFGNTESGRPSLMIGASITDIGSITWTKNAQVRHGENLSRDLMTSSSINALTDSLKVISGKLVDTNEFTTSLPTMLRIGGKLDLDAMGAKIGSFSPAASIEFAAGLSNTVGSLKSPRIGFGFTMSRHSDDALPLRFGAGFAIEKNASDISLAVGTTILDYVKIDIATGHFLELFSSNSRLDLALGISAMF